MLGGCLEVKYDFFSKVLDTDVLNNAFVVKQVRFLLLGASTRKYVEQCGLYCHL